MASSCQVGTFQTACDAEELEIMGLEVSILAAKSRSELKVH